MSGQVGNNILRTSGVVAATAAGLNWVSTVVTASTVTVSAGNGYPINTTSNTCTITLPSSAEAGDQIVLMDYLRTWGTNKIIIDSNGLNYQGEADTYTVEYDTNGETVNIVYSGATQGWIPLDDDDVTDAPTPPPTQKAIFGFGTTGDGGSAAGVTATTNLVNSSGVVASDTSGVGTARYVMEGAGYGIDKAIFAFGDTGAGGSTATAISNLVSNSGVVASDTAGVGTARYGLGAATYGTDKAIFAYGTTGSNVSLSNLVSSSGVVASDTTGVGSARRYLSATNYGGTSTAIFAYGYISAASSLSNLVSSSGVIASDTTGVGTAREGMGSAGYGYDKAIFAYGYGGGYLSLSNLVTSSGVIGSDVSGVGTVRYATAASTYGGDKAIFGYGLNGDGVLSMTNLVNNSGVVGSDVTGVGTPKYYLSAAAYSSSA